MSNLSFKELTEILFDFLSISTKSTFAPHNSPQVADEINEFGTVQKKSPFFRPRARQEACKALVALLKVSAYLDLTCFEISFSNFLTSGPPVK